MKTLHKKNSLKLDGKKPKIIKTIKKILKQKYEENNYIDRKLRIDLDNVYSKIKFQKNEYIDNLNKIINKNVHEHFKYNTNLCIINFYINGKNSKFEILNRSDLPKDNRIVLINVYCKRLIEWLKLNIDLKFETSLLIWISDRFIWEVENVDRKLPICLYACPKNMNYIIIPDNTFNIMSTQQRYASKGLDWSGQKKLFTRINLNKKLNKVFFRGADTTDSNHNLRRYIYDRLQDETDSDFKTNMIYEFLTTSNYESIEKTAKYKFQLNLPGRYPWSTRLKYLYLFKSFIINIRVRTIGDLEVPDEHYKTFIDLIVPDNLMFNIDMIYKYYDYKLHDNNNVTDKAEYDEFNRKECEKVYKKIKEIYNKYKNIDSSTNYNVLKANEIVNDINDNNMHKYYYAILLNNHKLGIPIVNKRDIN